MTGRSPACHHPAGDLAQGDAAGGRTCRLLLRHRTCRLPLPDGRPQLPRPDGDRRLRRSRASSSISSSSSFILIDHYGLSPSVYSVFFSINAVAFIGMSQLTGMLAERFGLRRVVRVAVAGYATTMVALVGRDGDGRRPARRDGGAAVRRLRLSRPGHSDALRCLPWKSTASIAGTASALMGTLQFAIGAVAMGVAGVFFDGTPLPMVVGIAHLRGDLLRADPGDARPGARSRRSAGRIGKRRHVREGRGLPSLFMSALQGSYHRTSPGSEGRVAAERLPAAMASATRARSAATAKVIRMPDATAWGGAVAISVVAEASANTAPMTDAPDMSPRLRDRLSMPDTTPRWSGRISAMTTVLLAAWNNW